MGFGLMYYTDGYNNTLFSQEQVLENSSCCRNDETCPLDNFPNHINKMDKSQEQKNLREVPTMQINSTDRS